MPNFESGVKGYVTGKAVITVNFPIDFKGSMNVCCYQCKYYSQSSRVCQLNKEVPAYPQKYIGQYCPLKFENEEE